MSVALVAVGHERDLTGEQVDLIKRTICRGATDDELALFVQTAQRLGLDPFARQIFAVKRWDSRDRKEVMSIQVSIDGFRLVAERTNAYAPGRPTEYESDGGQLVSATAFVKKLAGGQWHEVAETAHWDEYVQRGKDGGPTAMWARMPRVMLAKCAEARALRRAFPAQLSGVYTSDEMGQATSPDAIDVQVEPMPAPPQLPRPVAAPPRPVDEAKAQAAADLAEVASNLELVWKYDTASRSRWVAAQLGKEKARKGDFERADADTRQRIILASYGLREQWEAREKDADELPPWAGGTATVEREPGEEG